MNKTIFSPVQIWSMCPPTGKLTGDYSEWKSRPGITTQQFPERARLQHRCLGPLTAQRRRWSEAADQEEMTWMPFVGQRNNEASSNSGGGFGNNLLLPRSYRKWQIVPNLFPILCRQRRTWEPLKITICSLACVWLRLSVLRF